MYPCDFRIRGTDMTISNIFTNEYVDKKLRTKQDALNTGDKIILDGVTLRHEKADRTDEGEDVAISQGGVYPFVSSVDCDEYGHVLRVRTDNVSFSPSIEVEPYVDEGDRIASVTVNGATTELFSGRKSPYRAWESVPFMALLESGEDMDIAYISTTLDGDKSLVMNGIYDAPTRAIEGTGHFISGQTIHPLYKIDLGEVGDDRMIDLTLTLGDNGTISKENLKISAETLLKLLPYEG